MNIAQITAAFLAGTEITITKDGKIYRGIPTNIERESGVSGPVKNVNVTLSHTGGKTVVFFSDTPSSFNKHWNPAKDH